MTIGWLLFSLVFVGVVSTLVIIVWVKKARENRYYVKNEIIKRLGHYAHKDRLIASYHIKEARKLLKSGIDFDVIYKPEAPGCWQHDPHGMTGDGSIDFVSGATNVYEQEVLEKLGEITDETLREHPEVREWLRWKEGIPETLIIRTKREKQENG